MSQVEAVLTEAVNAVFIIFCGSLVFWMKAGFAFLEAGSVQKQSVLAIILKNNIDVGLGIIIYWATGWAWAFGQASGSNGFIGTGEYFNIGQSESTFPLWFFQFAFCAAAITIVSGAIAERVRFHGYLVFSFFGYLIIQPVVAHWIWSPLGWASCFNPNPLFGVGVLDFAGGGVVHMVGGASALAALVFAGYRNKYVEQSQRERSRHPERLLPRFEKDADGNWKENPLTGSSGLMVALGAFILFFGWLGFNAGSIIEIIGSTSVGGVTTYFSRTGSAGRAMICTVMAAGSGMLTAIILGRIESRNELFHKYSLAECLNGLLAGLVCITPGAGYVAIWASIPFGIIGACAYKGISMLLSSTRVRFDDPVDAVAVHLGAGMAGLFLTGLFAVPSYVAEIGCSVPVGGGFYVSQGGTGLRLGAQLLAIVCIFAWCFGLSFLIFGAMWLFDRKRGAKAIFYVRSAYGGQIMLKATDHDEELQAAFMPKAFQFADEGKTMEDGALEEDMGARSESEGRRGSHPDSIERQFSNTDVELDDIGISKSAL